MRDDFAQKALGRLLPQGDDDRLLNDLRRLATLAEFKYDEYQQFRPGRKFLESLIRWLEQRKPEHRADAFRMVVEDLVFFSRADIFHYTTMAYRHCIRRRILEHEANGLEIPSHRWLNFSRSYTMRAIEKQTIFLGLSDGAHIDDFRRAAAIHNDLVHSTYEITPTRLNDMVDHMSEWITDNENFVLAEGLLPSVEKRFRHVCLIDDFTASGTSFIRREGTEWKGKIPKFLKNHGGGDGESFDWSKTRMFFVFYIASSFAIQTINSRMKEFNEWRQGQDLPMIRYELIVIQHLPDYLPLSKDGVYAEMINAYNVESTWSKSMEKGGPPGHQKWGFRECALPVVLFHNTPNNSIAPLWIYEDKDEPGLFPRVTRHWDED